MTASTESDVSDSESDSVKKRDAAKRAALLERLAEARRKKAEERTRIAEKRKAAGDHAAYMRDVKKARGNSVAEQNQIGESEQNQSGGGADGAVADDNVARAVTPGVTLDSRKRKLPAGIDEKNVIDSKRPCGPPEKLQQAGGYKVARDGTGKKHAYFVFCEAEHEHEHAPTGSRVIDVQGLAEFISTGCTGCRSKTRMTPVGETRRGLQSELVLQCERCNQKNKFLLTGDTSPSNRVPGRPAAEANVRAVLGVLASGNHFATLELILSSLNMPGMVHKSWDATVEKIGDVLEPLVEDALDAAHEKELEFAKAKKRARDEPEEEYHGITIFFDGTWAKRSKRAGAGNSDQGAAFGMGLDSRSILEYGVKQKSCAVCDRAKNRKETSPHALEENKKHCPKNWSQSAKAMEAYLGSEILERMPKRRKLLVRDVDRP
jgi:hypothetical protein